MSFSTKLNVMTCMRDKCPSEFKKFSNLMSKIHKMSEDCVSDGKLDMDCVKKHVLKKKKTLVKISKLINNCMSKNCHEHINLVKFISSKKQPSKHTKKHHSK
jgi:hypothetical protein